MPAPVPAAARPTRAAGRRPRWRRARRPCRRPARAAPPDAAAAAHSYRCTSRCRAPPGLPRWQVPRRAAGSTPARSPREPRSFATVRGGAPARPPGRSPRSQLRRPARRSARRHRGPARRHVAGRRLQGRRCAPTWLIATLRAQGCPSGSVRPPEAEAAGALRPRIAGPCALHRVSSPSPRSAAAQGRSPPVRRRPCPRRDRCPRRRTPSTHPEVGIRERGVAAQRAPRAVMLRMGRRDPHSADSDLIALVDADHVEVTDPAEHACEPARSNDAGPTGEARQRAPIQVIVVTVGEQRHVHDQRREPGPRSAAQVHHSLPQNGIGEHPKAVHRDQHGGMAHVRQPVPQPLTAQAMVVVAPSAAHTANPISRFRRRTCTAEPGWSSAPARRHRRARQTARSFRPP